MLFRLLCEVFGGNAEKVRNFTLDQNFKLKLDAL